MMHGNLHIRLVQSSDLSSGQRAEIIALCNAAYGEDLESLFLTFGLACHVLGFEPDLDTDEDLSAEWRCGELW